MRTFGMFVAAQAIALYCSSAHALDEQLSITQAIDGTITATLSGLRYPCTYAWAGTPTVMIDAYAIAIASPAVGLGCPVRADDAPTAFAIDAVLGILTDGSYVVRWTVSGAASYQVRTSFTVAGGTVPQSVASVGVPTLSLASTAGLALLLTLSGAALIARPCRRSSSAR
jgi:hypothetical protein